MKTILWTTNDNDSIRRLSNHLEYLSEEQHKGQYVEFVIEIKRNRPVRSVKANRYYWAVLKHISTYSGHDEDEMHEYYKKKFNPVEVMGETIGGSTKDLDVAEFKIYVEKVKKHAKDTFEANIPEPQDKHYLVWEKVTKDNYDAMFLAA